MRATSIAAGAHPIDPGAASLRESFRLATAFRSDPGRHAPFTLDNTYARDLEGFSVPWRPEAAPAPKSLFFNAPLAEELGLDAAALAGEAGAAVFAGNAVPEGADPIAQAYAGHQFGGFSPQLGDGRAVLLGEVIDAPASAATSPSRARAGRRFRAAATARQRSADAARGADRRGDARSASRPRARSRSSRPASRCCARRCSRARC